MRSGNLRKAHRLLAPRVAYLIGTRSVRGESNLIPVSNVTSISTDPQLITLAVFRKWMTFENLVNASAFTLSVPKVEQLPGVWQLGARYSRFRFESTAEKMIASGLSILDPDDLPAPVLEDGLGWLACRMVQQVDVNGDHGVFIGEVTRVAFDGRSFDSEGMPTAPLHPLMQVTGNRFTTSGETTTIEYGK